MYFLRTKAVPGGKNRTILLCIVKFRDNNNNNNNKNNNDDDNNNDSNRVLVTTNMDVYIRGYT